MSRAISSPLGRYALMAGALLYLAMPALLPLMSKSNLVDPAQAEAQRRARNTSAFAVMLGEFRTSLSDMLFIKTERYLDRGVGYEPHVDPRAMASAEGSDDHDSHGHDHDHDHDHDHADVKTLVKTADEDFRGFIGNMERQVKPWRAPDAPHEHASGTGISELLPWYRLATLSNPHDVRNYYIGAWWLKSLRTPRQRQEALDFLNEGIAANQAAYELHLMKGYVQKDMDQLDEARKSFHESARLGVARRPPGGATDGAKPDWDTTNDEQLNAAIGMDVMLTRDLQTTAAALQLLSTYKQKMPDEGGLDRMKHVLEPGN